MPLPEYQRLLGSLFCTRTANVIAVRVQNKLPSSRWYSGSGIYRHTHLVVTDPVHVARWGTYVTTPGLAETVGDGYAEVRAEVEVANESGSPADVTVVTTVLDDDGASIGSAQAELAVPDSS